MFKYNVSVNTEYGQVNVQFYSDVNCLSKEEINERIHTLRTQNIISHWVEDLDEDNN